MRRAFCFVAVWALLLLTAAPALAQQPAPTAPAAPATAKTGFGAGIGAGVGMGLSVIGIGVGVGLIGFSAIGGIARQPEATGRITGVMYVLAALVEGAGIIGIILCLSSLFLAS